MSYQTRLINIDQSEIEMSGAAARRDGEPEDDHEKRELVNGGAPSRIVMGCFQTAEPAG
jgi:hypothetical protein